MGQAEIVIAGGGLAGLCCARHLHRLGMKVRVLEASDGPGGRVRTDRVEGFLLDRGFQVLLSAYPEARQELDYAALDLKPFYPGAMVWLNGRFHRMADPWRSPIDAAASLLSPIGSFADKLRVAALRSRVRRGGVDSVFDQPERTTFQHLQGAGFSGRMIDHFFRPFFGGIFLERELRTSSRMFDFVFRMMSEGDICIPAAGMGAIPEQLAAGLPAGALELGAKVESVSAQAVTLAGGTEVRADAVVVATEGPATARLTHGAIPDPGSRSASCYYFAADQAPYEEPILALNGESRGPVNNFAVMSNVAPGYAPPGAALFSATVLAEPAGQSQEPAVREQLTRWFGAQVNGWKLLARYEIAHAQPEQAPPALSPPRRPVRLESGVFLCGDHRENASINGAMASGRRAAEAVLESLGR